MNINIIPQRMEFYFEKHIAKFPNCNIYYGEENIENADVIYGNPSLEQIYTCKNLKWIQTVSAGVDAYIKGGFPENISLTNATGAYGLAISEHLLAMHLSLIKKFNHYFSSQQKNEWINHGMVKAVDGSTVLILGLGDIGGKYAKIVKAMGAYVIGLRRSDSQKPDYVDEIHLSEKLDELLPRADVVAIALPGTAQTKHLINKHTLSLMKKDAIILNVGRGSIIDSSALCEALNSGNLAGAGLDVTEIEPLPSGDPLWSAKNLVLTPHISGGFGLEQTISTNVSLFADNLERFIKGQPLKNTIDFEQGYRKL
ncbi:MAG: D-2-hydroxyacid dehydrogenase [Clostridia bacterium]